MDECRAASGGKPLELTETTVSRRLILLERDTEGERYTQEVHATLVLARCPCCGTRRRVLPYDVLPYKHYSLPVIAEQVTSYAKGGSSLREVAWDLLGEPAPSYKTIHGWTEGLGAHALGLPGGDLGGLPFAGVVSEAEARTPAAREVRQAFSAVDERRYRSEPRRERLAAVAQVGALVRALTVRDAPEGWAECRRLILMWTGWCAVLFPSRIFFTPITQGDRSDLRSSRSCAPQSQDRCPIRTRSPPGASNKSPR